MNVSNEHIIGRLVHSIKSDQWKRSHKLEYDIENITRQKILDITEDVFNRIIPDDIKITIDQLNIKLKGDDFITNQESYLISYSQALEKAIRSNVDISKLQERHIQESFLSYYNLIDKLKFGIDHWNFEADGSTSFRTRLLDVFIENKVLIINLLEEIKLDENRIKRFESLSQWNYEEFYSFSKKFDSKVAVSKKESDQNQGYTLFIQYSSENYCTSYRLIRPNDYSRDKNIKSRSFSWVSNPSSEVKFNKKQRKSSDSFLNYEDQYSIKKSRNKDQDVVLNLGEDPGFKMDLGETKNTEDYIEFLNEFSWIDLLEIIGKRQDFQHKSLSVKDIISRISKKERLLVDTTSVLKHSKQPNSIESLNDFEKVFKSNKPAIESLTKLSFEGISELFRYLNIEFNDSGTIFKLNQGTSVKALKGSKKCEYWTNLIHDKLNGIREDHSLFKAVLILFDTPEYLVLLKELEEGILNIEKEILKSKNRGVQHKLIREFNLLKKMTKIFKQFSREVRETGDGQNSDGEILGKDHFEINYTKEFDSNVNLNQDDRIEGDVEYQEEDKISDNDPNYSQSIPSKGEDVEVVNKSKINMEIDVEMIEKDFLDSFHSTNNYGFEILNRSKKSIMNTSLYINNAGLILVWPYLQQFFSKLNLMDSGKFNSLEAQNRATLLMHYMVYSETPTNEHQLILNKILCGVDLETFVNIEESILPSEKEMINSMLKALIMNWTALGSTTVEGLRESFLSRNGHVIIQDEKIKLTVEKKSFDVLLQQLPWNISIVKNQWMKKPIETLWI